MAATKAKPKVETLTESTFCEGVSLRVDREKGEIAGVKIVGLESQNGRIYTPAALKGAIGLYEGAKVNVNHPKNPGDPRDYRDRLGHIHGVEFREGQGLFGTLQFNPKHALAEQLAWDAEHNPKAVGFSHNAEGYGARRGGKLVVESITRVRSVDLVADPATTTSLREHVEGETTVAEAVASEKQSDSPLLSLLESYLATASPALGKTPMAAIDPAAMGEIPGANPALREALKSLLTALADDPSIDDNALADELRKLVANTLTKPSPDANAGDDPFADPESGGDNEMVDEPEKKKPVTEQIAEAVQAATQPLVEQVAGLSKQLDARAVLESKGAAPAPQLIEELIACADRAAMEKLVEGWSPAKLGKQKPRVGPLTESVGAYPKDKSEFLRRLKSGR